MFAGVFGPLGTAVTALMLASRHIRKAVQDLGCARVMGPRLTHWDRQLEFQPGRCEGAFMACEFSSAKDEPV